MNVKKHYDTHLADFYSWIVGDFTTKQQDFQKFLEDNAITPTSTKIAIDLGAGHGLQSVSLAKLGFNVTAIDFSQQLLSELKSNAEGLNIEIVNDDIRNIRRFADKGVELIVCCGDTLSHLDNRKEIENLLVDISETLLGGGNLILSFRDYSTELSGDNRFIPVRSDENRILTCVLDYDNEMVNVTDLLHERTETGWKLRVSSYKKVRISTNEVVRKLEAIGLKVQLSQVINRMSTIIALKP
ncbi:MAG: class I SAM-dependent methyltransferase [Chryseolinea sp.]